MASFQQVISTIDEDAHSPALEEEYTKLRNRPIAERAGFVRDLTRPASAHGALGVGLANPIRNDQFQDQVSRPYSPGFELYQDDIELALREDQGIDASDERDPDYMRNVPIPTVDLKEMSIKKKVAEEMSVELGTNVTPYMVGAYWNEFFEK